MQREDGTWYDAETGFDYSEWRNQEEKVSKPKYVPSDKVQAHRAYAKLFGGKALTGTDKQKNWAEKIRAEKLAQVSDNLAAKMLTVIYPAESAKFWIENRDKPASQMAAYAGRYMSAVKGLNRVAALIEQVHVNDKTRNVVRNKPLYELHRQYAAMLESSSTDFNKFGDAELSELEQKVEQANKDFADAATVLNAPKPKAQQPVKPKKGETKEDQAVREALQAMDSSDDPMVQLTACVKALYAINARGSAQFDSIDFEGVNTDLVAIDMMFDGVGDIQTVTDSDIQADPLAVLDLCVGVLEQQGAEILPFPVAEMNEAYYHSSRQSMAIAKDYEKQYLRVIEQAQAKARPLIETPEQQAAFDQAKKALMTEYLQRANSLMSARSGVYSWLMAGRAKLNTRQVERRGNAFDKSSGDFNNWVEHRAPNMIYYAVRSAMNDEQRQRERDQRQEEAKAVMDQAAMQLWGLLSATLPQKFAGHMVSGIGFSRDGMPSSLTIGGGFDPVRFTSVYHNQPYSVETLVNHLKAKGFDVPTKASQIKKAGAGAGAKKPEFNPDYKTITMDEWKAKNRDYKTILDGQRYVFGATEGGGSGMIPVNVVKSLAAFDSIGSELDAITDQDIQADPLAVLDLCVGVLEESTDAITPTGRTNPVKTAKGTKIGTQFAVVEVEKLITSHDSAGNENPAFPQELQPRDRGRDASRAWVSKVANSLDPDSLGRTSRADSGAPIVGRDGIVESGNGRTMAIRMAYDQGTADEYREFLISDADYFGIDPDQVERMKRPVLVRVRTTEIDRRVFTVEANQDDKLALSATERARSDSKRLDANMLALFKPDENGSLLTLSNHKFIQAFLASLGDAEAAQYVTKGDKPTRALVDRIRAAVFSKAYNDDRLLEMMADDANPDLQNVLNALGAASSKFIEAQAFGRAAVEDTATAMVDGIEQSLDERVTSAVIEATNTLLSARANNQDVTEYVRQQGLFEDIDDGVAALAVFLAQNSRSAKRMAIAFKAMAEYVKDDAISQANNGLFGEPTPPSLIDVVAAANIQLEQEYGDDSKNIGLFDSYLADGRYDHIHLDDLQMHPYANAAKERQPTAKTPLLVQKNRRGDLYLIAGVKRYEMALDDDAEHMPAVILPVIEGYGDPVIKRVLNAYTGSIDPLALMAAIEDAVVARAGRTLA